MKAYIGNDHVQSEVNENHMITTMMKSVSRGLDDTPVGQISGEFPL